MPQAFKCPTRAAKSAVKVPKQRTDSSLRSGGTATHSSVEPISRPAASGCRGATGWVGLDLAARRVWLFMAGWSQLATAGAGLRRRTNEAISHLLLFHEPFADHLVDGRFHKGCRDDFSLPVALAVIRNKSPILGDVSLKGADGLEQFTVFGAGVLHVQRIGQLIEDLQGPIDLPVPEVPFEVLKHFLQVGAQLRVPLGLH